MLFRFYHDNRLTRVEQHICGWGLAWGQEGYLLAEAGGDGVVLGVIAEGVDGLVYVADVDGDVVEEYFGVFVVIGVVTASSVPLVPRPP